MAARAPRSWRSLPTSRMRRSMCSDSYLRRIERRCGPRGAASRRAEPGRQPSASASSGRSAGCGPPGGTMESGEFAARARRAYELGRLQWALRGASGTLLLVTASVLFGGNMLLRLVVGAALLLTVTFCLWRGQMLATAVRPGLLAGLFPFGLLLTMRCAAGHFCEIADCGHWMAFCGAGGLVAGVLLAAHAWHLRDGA